jgi:hypothetical protein
MLRALSSRSLFLGAALAALAPFVLHAQAASTTCSDGSTSTATGRGACSRHGGIAKKSAKADTKAAKADAKADKADAKTAKAADKVASKSVTSDVRQTGKSGTDATGATAKCKDGTYSHAASRRGACSRHGGVADWLKS